MMSRRKFNFFIVLFILGLTWRGSAQEIRAEGPLFLGTKTPYKAPGGSYTPPPAGYAPVFINYVGRHGARFMTKAGADLRVWEVLQAADKSNSLTPKGREIKAMTERLLAIEKDKYEQITLLGREEQTAI